jgi:hypothetical protein
LNDDTNDCRNQRSFVRRAAEARLDGVLTRHCGVFWRVWRQAQLYHPVGRRAAAYAALRCAQARRRKLVPL